MEILTVPKDANSSNCLLFITKFNDFAFALLILITGVP